MAMIVSTHPVPVDQIDEVLDYAPMMTYIADATAAWWSHLSGLAPEDCRALLANEDARSASQDLYIHLVEQQGKSDIDAVASAGAFLVSLAIDDADDQKIKELRESLRNHVRDSVREG